MGTVTVELSEFAPSALADKNERDIAGCSGHDFVALNSYIYNSNYWCRNCGGVVHYDGALKLGVRMSPRYYAWLEQQQAAA